MIPRKYYDVSSYKTENLYCLDSIRGVMAIIIFSCHFFAMSGYILPSFGNFAPFSYLTNTKLALSYFFLLSGFVISYSQQYKGRKIHILNYGVRRYLRLLPPILISVFAMWILIVSDNLSVKSIMSKSSWLQSLPCLYTEIENIPNPMIDSLFNVYFTGFSFYNCNLWAIKTEFIIPFLLVPINAFISYKMIRLILVLITLIGLLLTLEYSLIYSFEMILGMLLCYYIRFINYDRFRSQILTTFLILFILNSFHSDYVKNNNAIHLLIQLLIASYIIIIVVNEKRINIMLGWLKGLGKISYEIYVYHLVILFTFGSFVFIKTEHARGVGAVWFAYFTTLFITIIISLFLAKVIEYIKN